MFQRMGKLLFITELFHVTHGFSASIDSGTGEGAGISHGWGKKSTGGVENIYE